MIEDKSFVFKYSPLKAAANRLEISTDRLILEAMKGTISLHFVNQSSKTLHYAPLNYEKGWSRLKHLLKLGYKWQAYSKGEMLELLTLRQLDFLAKGILTEKDALLRHPDGDHWLAYRFTPILQFIHANYLTHTFYPVTLDHVFILRSELETLKAELEAPKQLDDDETEPTESGAQTRQEQRELIFIAWLNDKDEHKVSLMKKEDVLVELRKIDPHLFMGDQKHFFRLQKRIVFKSGRKAENSD